MGRHSKNAGTMGAEALTYHERRALGYGTVKERLGKVSRGGGGTKGWWRPSILPCLSRTLSLSISLRPQDSLGNYYDCRLTLQPVVVSVCAKERRGSGGTYSKHLPLLNTSSLATLLIPPRIPSPRPPVTSTPRKPS